MLLSGSTRTHLPPSDCQEAKAKSIDGSGVICVQDGSKRSTMAFDESKEDRKADGARSVTFLTPIPPHLTGSEACAQDSSVSFTLVIDETMPLITSSS